MCERERGDRQESVSFLNFTHRFHFYRSVPSVSSVWCFFFQYGGTGGERGSEAEVAAAFGEQQLVVVLSANINFFFVHTATQSGGEVSLALNRAKASERENERKIERR